MRFFVLKSVDTSIGYACPHGLGIPCAGAAACGSVPNTTAVRAERETIPCVCPRPDSGCWPPRASRKSQSVELAYSEGLEEIKKVVYGTR